MPNLYLIAPARSGAQAVKQTLLQDSNWRDAQQVEEAGFGNSKATPTFITYEPQDCFEIAEIAESDPDGRFLFIARTPVEVIASSVQAWRSGRFVTQDELQGWWGEKWSLQLLPDWEKLIGAPLTEVCATQFFDSIEAAIMSLGSLETSRWQGIHFEDFTQDPKGVLKGALKTLGLDWSGEIENEAQLSNAAIEKPSREKWHRSSVEILQTLNPFEDRGRSLNQFRLKFGPLPPVILPKTDQPIALDKSEASAGTPFASSFTDSLVELLSKAKASLLISTYKSGKLITARVEGSNINTSFQDIRKPMGIAAAGSRLAVGTKSSIVSFANQPSLARHLKTLRPATSVFIRKSEVVTGDIAIHEMAYGTSKEDRDLYFVNTSFSCLCVMDPDYSWVPIWRPSWITEYSAEDRCHLNGMAMRDGKPRYVTSLAETDQPFGWRELKGTSGVIVDIADNRVIASGLAMPHSPRWHRDQLWVLESGKGTIAKVDEETGEVTTVATLPGFTRGLAFIGRYAFVGLSQVRESVFKSLPVTNSKQERNCGVWVVDTDIGQIVGFLRFEGAVQEIFDVAVLSNTTWPEFMTPNEVSESYFVLPDEVVANFKNPRQKTPLH